MNTELAESKIDQLIITLHKGARNMTDRAQESLSKKASAFNQIAKLEIANAQLYVQIIKELDEIKSLIK